MPPPKEATHQIDDRPPSAWQKAFFFFWIGLLTSPNIVYIIISKQPFEKGFFALFWSIIFIAAVTNWLRSSRWILAIFFPFFILLPLEIYYIITYHHPSTPHIIGVVYETNPLEALDYLGSRTTTVLTIITLATALVTLKLAKTTINIPLSSGVYLIRMTSLSILFILGYFEWEAQAHQPPPQIDNLGLSTTLMGMSLSEGFPQGIPIRLMLFMSDLNKQRRASKAISQWNFQPLKTNKRDSREVFVLVIGESSNPRHWGINGYHRDTTPQIASITDVVSLRNVISPYARTRQAVPSLLTGLAPAPWGHGSILTLFRQAGFYVAWLSNQSPTGIHDSTIGAYVQEANSISFINIAEFYQPGRTDKDLLPLFETILHGPEPQKLIIVHLLGSHKAYHHRYSAEFDRFLPSLMSDPKDPSPQTLINSYDNSIYHTDYVLASMIRALESLRDTRAGLIYASDHGENLPHDACNASGHGFSNEDDFRVSALIWLSPSLQADHPEWLDLLRSRINAPLLTIDIFPTLADLAGIDYVSFSPERSWVRHEWKPRVRSTEAVPDFDRALRVPPCAMLKMPP